MGKSLTSSVQHFNKAVGSMDTRILPSAKKFTEMGIHADKPVEQVSQIETTPRSVESNSEQDTKQKQKKADPVV
jgi:DNA recombination protein RmuC